MRQAIIAVCSGNPLLMPEEQLLANYQPHEYEGEQELAYWLRAARFEYAQRRLIARLRAVEKPVVLDAHTQWAELLALLDCPALDQPQKLASFCA